MQFPDQIEKFTICRTAVQQDEVGRYCLNDLHKAAGGEKRHQPADWLRLQQTREFVALLDAEVATPGIPGVEQNQWVTEHGPVPGIPGTEQNQALKVYLGGNGRRGTYVCKEFVPGCLRRSTKWAS